MGLSSKKVLGVDITTSGKDYILEEIRKYLRQIQSSKFKVQNEKVKPFVIFTPNPEIITYSQKDEKFKESVNSAQINIPDGTGISWAIGKLYKIDVPKISGVDLMPEICRLAEKESFTVGLIGGEDGVAIKTAECLRQSYNNLKVEVLPEPEIEISNLEYQKSKINIKNQKKVVAEEYFQNLTREIVRRKIDILFVALGCPKQEYLIDKLKVQSEKLKINHPLVLMAVGGSFDYLSGRITRAPFWMREKGLEWLYRLVREPWRLLRQIKGGTFFLRVLVRQLQIQLHLI